MKHLFTLILCLASVCTMHAQSVSLFNIDASGFPTMKAKFFAFDAANKQQRPSKSELTITENGQPRTITSVTCSPDTAKSLSVCIMVDTYGYGLIKLAQAGTQRLINYLLPPKDEIAITMMNKGVQIHQDFTSDTAKATVSATSIPPAPGYVDVQKMFYYPYTGGVPFISGRTSDKKVLILVSDLHCPKLNLDTARLYQDAAQHNISVYAVLLGTTDISGLFKRIALKTGGQVFESVSTETQITNIFQEIERREHSIPCEITWESGSDCEPRIDVGLNWSNATSKTTYEIQNSQLANLLVTPALVYMDNTTLTSSEFTVQLTSQNADFIVNDVILKYGSQDFSIVNTTFPFLIPKDSSKPITLRYTPTDKSIKYADFEIQTDKCSSDLSGISGKVGQKIGATTLKLTQPNGGETFLAGSDTVIKWVGIAKSDTVSLEYSIDNGNTWKIITKKANNLQFNWKNIPKPASTQCKVLVKQLDKGKYSNSILGTQLFDLTGHSGFLTNFNWSPNGAMVATTSNDYTTIIWDATTSVRLHTLQGHIGIVRAVSWSPDGAKIVTASSDKTLKIWEVAKGTLLYTLQGNTNWVVAVQWSPDGSKIVSSSLDNTATVWDAASGTNLLTLNGHSRPVTEVNWSPNGSKISTVSEDQTAIIWDATSGIAIHTLSMDGHIAISAKWSPDGNKVGTVSSDTTAKIWDVNSGKLIRTIHEHDNINSLSWSPDGSKVATANSDGTASIWDAFTATNFFILKGHTGWVAAVEWSPDGSNIATMSGDSTIRIWGATTGILAHTLNGNSSRIIAMHWSPDGTKIAIASLDNKAIIWEAANGKKLHTLSGNMGSVEVVKWSPDGTRVASAGGDKTIKIWDANTSATVYTLDALSTYVMDFDWSPDGSKFATASFDNTARIWDATTGKIIFTLPCDSRVTGVKWSPDGWRVATASQGTSTKIWDATTGTLLHTFTGILTLAIFWSPDGSKVAQGNFDTLKIWNSASGVLLNSITGHTALITSISWSPDGSRIATSSEDKTVKIWIVKTGALDYTLLGHLGTVSAVRWNPAGTRIITSGFDTSVLVYDAIKGKLLYPLNGHKNWIFAIRWSPDGSKIATASYDSTAKIWDADSGKNLYTLSGHKGPVVDINWNNDGSKVATGSLDKTSKIWFIDNENFSLQADTSDAVFSIIAPEPTLQNLSIDMGKVLVGQSKDSTVLGIVCNKGSAPLHVLGIDITSGDSTDFTIPRGAGDFFLDSNECRDVMFGFAPTKVGLRRAQATIRTTVGDFIDTISINGEGIAPALAVVNPYIDFGQTLVGTPKDSTKVVTIKNVGTSDLTITQTDYNAVNTTNFSTLAGGNSFILKPNKEAIMDLRFLPNDVGRRSGILQFHYNGVGSPATVQLFGEGIINIPDTARTTVIAQDITAQAGEKVNLSLKLYKPSGMNVIGAPTEWFARIHYNKSILFNEQTNNVCPGTTDSCVLELTGVYNPKSDELISIPCSTTLGNADHSTIVIDTFYWTNSAIATEVATQNGSITLNGICDDGGVRLFIPAKNSTSLSSRPNPAQDKLQIQYGLREPLTVSLELLTMTGQVVQTIVTGQSQTAGQYTLTSDVSSLGNGVYLLRMTTSKETLTSRVDIVK